MQRVPVLQQEVVGQVWVQQEEAWQAWVQQVRVQQFLFSVGG